MDPYFLVGFILGFLVGVLVLMLLLGEHDEEDPSGRTN